MTKKEKEFLFNRLFTAKETVKNRMGDCDDDCLLLYTLALQKYIFFHLNLIKQYEQWLKEKRND